MITDDVSQLAGRRGVQDPNIVGEWDGLPFRLHKGQEHPTLRTHDAARKQPVEVMDAKVRIFDLSKPDDLIEYQRICDMLAKGKARWSAEEREFCSDIQNWRVFLRWCELYSELGREATVSHLGSATIYTGGAHGG